MDEILIQALARLKEQEECIRLLERVIRELEHAKCIKNQKYDQEIENMFVFGKVLAKPCQVSAETKEIVSLLESKLVEKTVFLQERLFQVGQLGKDITSFPLDHEIVNSFQNMYNDIALDALDELEQHNHSSEIIVQLFAFTLQVCEEIVEQIQKRIAKQVLFWTVSKNNEEQTIPKSIRSFVLVSIQSSVQSFISSHASIIRKESFHRLFRCTPKLSATDLRSLPNMLALSDQLARLCVYMSASTPSNYSLSTEFSTFDARLYQRTYDSNPRSDLIQSIEWPALFLDGKIVCKAFVKT